LTWTAVADAIKQQDAQNSDADGDGDGAETDTHKGDGSDDTSNEDVSKEIEALKAQIAKLEGRSNQSADDGDDDVTGLSKEEKRQLEIGRRMAKWISEQNEGSRTNETAL